MNMKIKQDNPYWVQALEMLEHRYEHKPKVTVMSELQRLVEKEEFKAMGLAFKVKVQHGYCSPGCHQEILL